ncbi:MAG TPA: DUF3500 domain-containing protein [Candidatus Limnocylindrales bacterium]|nr:DUF3500 domain-containing protein [Candidatus Limnocylindrales bacterium]
MSTTAVQLARIVLDWLATLDPPRRAQACFPFGREERFVWAFTPGDRDGLALRDMTDDQRGAAWRVVDAAMSERGAREARAVVALETILGSLEREQGRSDWRRRDPELYWFAVFGDPSTGAPWMWRVGGHHVAISLTVADGEIVGSSPSFLGANPAVVPSGPRAGERTLTGEEAFARALLAALSVDERSVAITDAVAPPEILTSNAARADVGRVPRGLRHGDMAAPGQAAFEVLIRHYLGRAADDIAAADWERAVVAGLGDTSFAWAGSTEQGQGHYYAVLGPRLLIEYDNTQNGANHIHAVWRDLTNDWGEDLLAAHYRKRHAAD